MFNFNGIDFSSSGLDIRAVKIDRPIMAPQKISSTNIDGKAGDIFHRKTSASYTIDVEFYLFSDNGLALINDIRTLAGMLDTDSPAQLIFNDETDKFLMAIVADTKVDRVNNHADCTVTFQIFDPFLYAVSDDIFTYAANGTYNFTRKGNTTSYPLIEIFGTSGKYTLVTNGVSMSFTGTINTGEKLVIDSSLLTAYILASDGVTKTSVISKLDKLNFPVLNKGANTFSISTASGAALTQCKITCNSRWK